MTNTGTDKVFVQFLTRLLRRKTAREGWWATRKF